MNLESRIKKLEKLSVVGSNEPIYVVWLPEQSETIEEWVERYNNPDLPCKWIAVSARGIEATYLGSNFPDQNTLVDLQRQ